MERHNMHAGSHLQTLIRNALQNSLAPQRSSLAIKISIHSPALSTLFCGFMCGAVQIPAQKSLPKRVFSSKKHVITCHNEWTFRRFCQVLHKTFLKLMGRSLLVDGFAQYPVVCRKFPACSIRWDVQQSHNNSRFCITVCFL